MGDLAASGGYWISMNADQIIANPSTITGSIGIFGLWFNVPKTMDKLGLHTDGVGTTWLTGAFDPTRPYDARVGELIQGYINHGYAQFIGKVAEARGRTPEEINQVARGRVWSGAQAKERGLIDRLGLLPDAIAEAATAPSSIRATASPTWRRSRRRSRASCRASATRRWHAAARGSRARAAGVVAAGAHAGRARSHQAVHASRPGRQARAHAGALPVRVE
jgi:ClpP class serine protease